MAEKNELTPMKQQYNAIKAQNQDSILFFRLGDFYEMFDEDARIASRELELVLTTRDRAKPLAEQTPMCGVPFHSADFYIARLVSKGYKVAICEQVEDPAAAKGIVKRDIVRIVTPGTVTASNMLEEKRNNYISAVYGLSHSRGRPFGVSPMAAIDRGRTEAYADVTRWMTQPGYIDYICPQLYTGFEHQTQPFTDLLARWTGLPRRNGVRLYGGLALYKAGLADDPYAGTGRGEWAEQNDIIARQVTALQAQTDGLVLFRYASLSDPAAQKETENLRPLLTAG